MNAEAPSCTKIPEGPATYFDVPIKESKVHVEGSHHDVVLLGLPETKANLPSIFRESSIVNFIQIISLTSKALQAVINMNVFWVGGGSMEVKCQRVQGSKAHLFHQAQVLVRAVRGENHEPVFRCASKDVPLKDYALETEKLQSQQNFAPVYFS